jgi:hypothetical protein
MEGCRDRGHGLRACVTLVWLCGWLLSGCGGHAPAAATVDAAASVAALPGQDRFAGSWQVAADAAVVASVPFATAARGRVAVHESITGAGQPVELGSIEIPEGWLVATPLPACPAWGECLLWRAHSPDGRAESALLAPLRESGGTPPAGAGPAPARVAASWLERGAAAGDGVEQVDAGQVEAVMPATRRRWSSGGAWRWLAHDVPDGRLHEWLALDVESAATGGRHRDAQSGPLLRIRAPAGQFDADAAQAVRASLRYRDAWFPAWWLAWELRQVRATCEGGFHDGLCRRQPSPYVDYFQAPSSIGVWDLRARGYDAPDARYDR